MSDTNEERTLQTVEDALPYASIAGGMIPQVMNNQLAGSGLEVLTTGGAAVLDNKIQRARYSRQLNSKLEHLGDGYRFEGENDAAQESLKGLNENTAHGVGLGVVSTLAGMGATALVCWLFTGGNPLGFCAGLALGIPVSMAVNWAYNAAVPKSACQDPLAIAGQMRTLREQGKEVPPEMGLAVMIASLPAESGLRHELEARLKKVSGSAQAHVALAERPDALQILAQDPGINDAFSARYGALDNPNFIKDAVGLYMQGRVSTKDFLYAHSGGLGLETLNKTHLTSATAQVNNHIPAMNKNGCLALTT